MASRVRGYAGASPPLAADRNPRADASHGLSASLRVPRFMPWPRATRHPALLSASQTRAGGFEPVTFGSVATTNTRLTTTSRLLPRVKGDASLDRRHGARDRDGGRLDRAEARDDTVGCALDRPGVAGSTAAPTARLAASSRSRSSRASTDATVTSGRAKLRGPSMSATALRASQRPGRMFPLSAPW